MLLLHAWHSSLYIGTQGEGQSPQKKAGREHILTVMEAALSKTNSLFCLKVSHRWFEVKCFFPRGSDDKESACNAGDSWVGKIPCRREQLPTPVFFA